MEILFLFVILFIWDVWNTYRIDNIIALLPLMIEKLNRVIPYSFYYDFCVYYLPINPANKFLFVWFVFTVFYVGFAIDYYILKNKPEIQKTCPPII
jgi:hypothetical protein